MMRRRSTSHHQHSNAEDKFQAETQRRPKNNTIVSNKNLKNKLFWSKQDHGSIHDRRRKLVCTCFCWSLAISSLICSTRLRASDRVSLRRESFSISNWMRRLSTSSIIWGLLVTCVTCRSGIPLFDWKGRQTSLHNRSNSFHDGNLARPLR